MQVICIDLDWLDLLPAHLSTQIMCAVAYLDKGWPISLFCYWKTSQILISYLWLWF